ncbi:YraN family protein [Candidatus Uhrbacteria bacterium]|nr:YraN family protein [Candidatus Uhrbacteria bacterium]
MAPEAKDVRRRFGDRGEDRAAAFFIVRGFRIVARNWSTRMGEIDLICEKDGVTHFVEVKTRRSTTYGYPEEAITPTKLLHLRRAIECYVQMSNVRNYQLDALAITILPGEPPEFYYVDNISEE